MEINAETLRQVIETIKQLPVQCDFDAADRWVGVVLVLEQMLQAAQTVNEAQGE